MVESVKCKHKNWKAESNADFDEPLGVVTSLSHWLKCDDCGLEYKGSGPLLVSADGKPIVAELFAMAEMARTT